MTERPFEPQIDRQANRGGGTGPDNGIDRLRMGQGMESRTYLYVEPSFREMVKHLESLSGARTDKAKESLRNELAQDCERIVTSQLAQLEDGLNNQLLRFKNPYPYDSRQQTMWFETLQEAARKSREESWGQSPEAKAWLDRVGIDTVWARSNFRLMEGVGGVIEKFFDGKQMLLGWVRERFRSDPTAEYYRGTFARTLPGFNLEQIRASLPERAHKGLRETAVEYQDDCAYWRIAVAAVGQKDYTAEGEQELMTALTDTKTDVIQQLFALKGEAQTQGDGEEARPDLAEWVQAKDLDHPIPKGILNWYTMAGTRGEKERYLATMQALLVLSSKRNLDKLEAEYPDGVPTDQIRQIVSEVAKKRDEIMQSWYSSDRPRDVAIASVVVKSGIVLDWGHMCSVPMSWGWTYKEEGGKLVKIFDEGGPASATDSSAPALWRHTEIKNQRKSWTKGMFIPTSDAYRKLLAEHSPYWLPDAGLKEALDNDPVLKQAWEELWQDDPELNWKWNDQLKKSLQEMVWAWETRWDVPGKEGIKMVLPIFFPPAVESVNFLNSIALSDTEGLPEGAQRNIKLGANSVWDELCAGGALSEFDWETMGDQALYGWLITINQVGRWTLIMLDPENENTKGQLIDFFGDPDKVIELLKRLDLGNRAEKRPFTILTVALAPLLIALRTTVVANLLSEKGRDQVTRENSAMKIAQWAAKFRNLPDPRTADSALKLKEGEKDGIAMLKILRFYATLIARIADVVGKTALLETQNEYDKLKAQYAEAKVKIGDRTVGMS
jgi:hypothetical protein